MTQPHLPAPRTQTVIVTTPPSRENPPETTPPAETDFAVPPGPTQTL